MKKGFGTVSKYYLLTKPGIIRANVMTAIAGYLLASQTEIDIKRLGLLVIGVAGVIAAACVLNNIIDRDIDKKMARTKQRGLATGEIRVKMAAVFALILGILGFLSLLLGTNRLTALVGLIGIIDYVILYGITKRTSEYGTMVGGISGSTAIVAGYTAATNDLDIIALILFLIMFTWQLPHFYAIAMFRLKDYKAAGLPVLPIKRGMEVAKLHILLYIIVFILAVLSLFAVGYTGYTYFIVMASLGSFWLWRGVSGLQTADDVAWGRRMFGFSLLVLTVFSVLISLERFLP